MLKNLIVYRIGPGWLPDREALATALEAGRFVPCAPTQPASVGWVPPRGEAHGALVEVVDGQWLLRLQTERKLLPASVVRRRVEERAAQIERSTGRKPGKREQRTLKDEVQLELLPLAFSREAALAVWIDPQARTLAVDTGSQARADEVVSALVKAADGLAVMLLQSQVGAASAMAGWLGTGEAPAGFTIDRECELKSPDEMKSVVRYARHGLDGDDVRQHIAGGKRPTRLAMTWADRVSFVLTEGLQLKKLDFLDVVFEARAADDAGFDADAAICTGELRRLIPELLDALGGELDALAPAPLPAPEAGVATVAPAAAPSRAAA
ncbi:recombination-associated protein RdgC [Piscinibacter sakaiensis]|uniref:Recombination-associated protein RdgC n=1 Tax=Piscinibacter sakaiensis TaxID=1547922 RepID=A0A0K8NW21_PISS1|nr:recombination-associated protein RdgC [Piscinibacter sakaiensis]GAP34484.1 DNA recombination-dependent growth factor C [Piscinibacter sakaiensis]